MPALKVIRMTIRTGRLLLAAASGGGLVLLAALLLGPSTGQENAFPAQDKLYHFLAFAAVALPAALALSCRGRAFWACHLLGFGLTSEIAQTMLGIGRDGSGLDFLADAAGIAAGVAIGGAGYRWMAARQPSSWAARSAK